MYSIIRDSVPMEYDNDENTWRRPSTPKVERRACHQIPKRSTTVAVVVLGLAVLSCLLGYCVLSETLPYESKTLRLVIILFRHGARTPVETYNSDPYKNYQWPDGLGGLTNAGKLQLYELGKKYRSYYANFIPEEYCDKDVFIRSSDRSRCLMSAYTFLAGLYPPTERQMWHPEIPWQPVPVHALPKELDNIVAGTKPCKKWKAMYQEQLAEKNTDPKFTELFDYLSKHTNQSMRSVLPVDFLYSTLLSEQEAGLKLPEWTKTVFPSKMRTPFMLSLALISYNESMQRLKGGPLLKEIKQYFEETVRHENVDRSLYVYSGHDVTVVSLWRAFGFNELLEPEYGASIVLELHEDVEQEAFFVKTFYRNNTKLEVPMELKLPFCDDPCTYSQFSRHVSNLIPSDWEAECGNIDNTHINYLDPPTIPPRGRVAYRMAECPLLKEIKQYFDETVRHENVDRSLYVYSGHDVTVVSLWRAFGFNELLEPEYGASIVLELHEDVEQEAFFVKTFYRNNTKLEVPMELKLPFCDDPCTYSQFSRHVSNLIPSDWEAECGNIDK